MAKKPKKKKSQVQRQPSNPPLLPNEPIIPQTSNMVSTPRHDKYQKLISRFYEPLIFLAALGQTRGNHTSTPSANPEQAIRRRFLRNIAFVCDHQKGGPTTMAIAVEERSDQHVFWFATNQADLADKVHRFLDSTLQALKIISNLTTDGESLACELEQSILGFAKKRVKDEVKLLQRSALKLSELLEGVAHESLDGTKLANWLSQFQSPVTSEPVSICQQAYQKRNAQEIKEIQSLLQVRNLLLEEVDPVKSPFWGFRHYLGRLAHHVRASRELVGDAKELGYLLSNFSVQQVSPMPSAPAPGPDDKTTLEGILNRMLDQKKDPERFRQLTEAMQVLDHKFKIHNKIIDWYQNPNFIPQVHCEIQILEHFYKHNYLWIRNDRYIACSKPACFCCQLYIRYHPANCIEPESHQKIYRKWGPPLLEDGVYDRNYIHQRGILNEVINVIRRQAMEQIVKVAGPHPWHADSLTGITSSSQLHPAGEASDDEFLDSTDDELSVVSDVSTSFGFHEETTSSLESVDVESIKTTVLGDQNLQ